MVIGSGGSLLEVGGCPWTPVTVIHLAEVGMRRKPDLQPHTSEDHLLCVISEQPARQNWITAAPWFSVQPGSNSNLHRGRRSARAATSSIEDITAGSRPVSASWQPPSTQTRQSGAVPHVPGSPNKPHQYPVTIVPERTGRSSAVALGAGIRINALSAVTKIIRRIVISLPVCLRPRVVRNNATIVASSWSRSGHEWDQEPLHL